MSKKGQKPKKYSPEYKKSVIMDMKENHLGYRGTERKYNIQHSVIAKWERIFLEEGIEGFMKKRGRPSKKMEALKDNHSELDKKTVEELIAENQWLRMENEYLKKLRALVLAEEQKNAGKR